jgi:hypothetical protein
MAWNLFSRSLTATAAGDVETALATAEEAAQALRGIDKSFPAVGTGLALAAALLSSGDAARAAEELLNTAEMSWRSFRSAGGPAPSSCSPAAGSPWAAAMTRRARPRARRPSPKRSECAWPP